MSLKWLVQSEKYVCKKAFAGLSVGQGVVASYLHGQVVEGQGKIGVLVVWVFRR